MMMVLLVLSVALGVGQLHHSCLGHWFLLCSASHRFRGVVVLLLGQESRRTKVSRIFRIFLPNFAPNFAPNFPRIFRGLFVLRFVGDGDQKKFTKNPRRFSMQNSQANTKKIFTKFFWRAGNISSCSDRSVFIIQVVSCFCDSGYSMSNHSGCSCIIIICIIIIIIINHHHHHHHHHHGCCELIDNWQQTCGKFQKRSLTQCV